VLPSALIAALSAATLLPGAPARKDKKPLALELSAKKATFNVGDRVAFTVTVRNNSGKPIKLDAKPARFLNNGYNALANGELLRRVAVEDGKAKTHNPDLTSFGGIEPAVIVRAGVLSLKTGEARKVTFGAKVVRDKEGKLRLLFDDPESPGLKRFGTRLSRSAWGFPVTGGKLTLRLIYDRGAVRASSNAVTLKFAAKE
jgi:hypothetical protein